MGLLNNGDRPTESRRAAEERQQEHRAEQMGMETASQQSRKQMEEVTENANFLEALRKAGIDTSQYRMESELGAAVADVHVVGNRPSDYEQTVKWGSIGKAEQHVVGRSPGRLVNDRETLGLVQGVADRPDRSADPPVAQDERRAIREAWDAVANHKSLAADAKGAELVGETTVTAKREVKEESESKKEKAGAIIS